MRGKLQELGCFSNVGINIDTSDTGAKDYTVTFQVGYSFDKNQLISVSSGSRVEEGYWVCEHHGGEQRGQPDDRCKVSQLVGEGGEAASRLHLRDQEKQQFQYFPFKTPERKDEEQPDGERVPVHRGVPWVRVQGA